MLGLIISAIVVGRIIGALGRLVLPGRQDMAHLAHHPDWYRRRLIGSLIASALGGRRDPRDRLDRA